MFYAFLPYLSALLPEPTHYYDELRYIAWCIVEGDALNDWLTHLPAAHQELWHMLGEIIVTLFS